MKHCSAAAMLGYLAVSTKPGHAIGDRESAAHGHSHPSPFRLLGTSPSNKVTALCNGQPAPLPPKTLDDRASEFECQGTYEVEAPLQDIDGDLYNLYGHKLRTYVLCDGHWQVSNVPSASQERFRNRSPEATRSAEDELEQIISCKGDFWNIQAAIDMSAGATTFAQGGPGAEHLAVVTTISCSGQVRSEDGNGTCWPADDGRFWSLSESQSTSFRVFAPATPLEAMDAAISEHVQWLRPQSTELPASRGDSVSAEASTEEVDIQCEHSCNGKPMAGQTSCQAGLSSKCDVALSSERYDVELAVETKCVGAAEIDPENKELTCSGALAMSGTESVEDKVGGRKAKFLLGDGYNIGKQTVTLINRQDWAGVHFASVPQDDAAAKENINAA